MIRIHTASRLHFGPLSVPGDGLAPGVRWFGGVGLMVADPGVALALTPADVWGAEGPLAERALTLARRWEGWVLGQGGPTIRPQQFVIAPGIEDHVGLGTGTQLALAVAWGLSHAWRIPPPTPEQAAHILGRGARSALGIHGFAQGGFLVEGGKRTDGGMAQERSAFRPFGPLVARADFPEDWRIILVRPHAPTGWHGSREEEAFHRLRSGPTPEGLTHVLCRLVLLGMLPALIDEDIQGFGATLSEYNARAGEFFAPAQGGIYASPRIAEVVRFAQASGAAGAGQSSWGPTTFAVVRDADQATSLAQGIRQHFGLNAAEVRITHGWNRGARLQRESEEGILSKDEGGEMKKEEENRR